ncbi:nuclease-related domain-containing protein [Arthrobacter sp. HLT1-21]
MTPTTRPTPACIGRAGRANIDHLAVGPGGILVIDAKNWSCDVGILNGELCQNGYARRRETPSLLQQCSAVAVLLEAQHRTMAQAWICLVQHPEIDGSTDRRIDGSTSTGARVIWIDQLVGAVLALPPPYPRSRSSPRFMSTSLNHWPDR